MRKTLNIIRTIATWLLVLLTIAVVIFTVFSVTVFDKNDRDIFGYKAYIVRSDSMKSVDSNFEKGYFKAGDLIFVKEVEPSTLKAGDIIAYTSINTESYGETITHMIKTVTTDAKGNPGFVTYGTSTGAEDANIVTYPYVLGKYTSHLAGVGTFFDFLKTPPGYILCIFVPIILLLVIQGTGTFRLMKKYKSEKLAETEAEREQTAAAMQADFERREAELKATLKKEKTELQAALEKEKVELQAEFERKNAALKTKFENEKNELQAAIDTEITQLRANIECERTKLQAQRQEMEAERKRLEETAQKLLDMQADLLDKFVILKQSEETNKSNSSSWSSRLKSAVQIVIGEKQ